MMRRLLLLVAFAACAWPAAAVGKEGAMFSQQLSTLPAARVVRVQLFVLDWYRGSRKVIPAPDVGSVPTVILRLLPTGRVVRYLGTPLDRNHRSIVRIRLPASSASQTWRVSVRADRHLYPDVIDGGSVTPGAGAAASSVAIPSGRAAGRRPGGVPAWPFLLAGLFLAASGGAVALIRSRRGFGESGEVPSEAMRP